MRCLRHKEVGRSLRSAVGRLRLRTKPSGLGHPVKTRPLKRWVLGAERPVREMMCAGNRRTRTHGDVATRRHAGTDVALRRQPRGRGARGLARAGTWEPAPDVGFPWLFRGASPPQLLASSHAKPSGDDLTTFAEDFRTYERELLKLLERFGEGGFVLIHRNEVGDVFRTQNEAMDAGYERHGPGRFLVKRILRIDQDDSSPLTEACRG